MKYEEMRERFANAPVLAEVPDSKAMEDLHELFRHPGLIHLYGLMLGSRQTQFQMLAQAPLGTASESCRASVIQGTIKGIELFYETVLEQCVSSHNHEGAI